MISFRFHLVSLVAVFLALGVGVLTGTTVINRGVVSRLEAQTDTLSGDLDALRGQLGDLQAQSEVWSQFGEEVSAPVLSGRLADLPVVLLTQEGTNEEGLAGVRRALETSGAEIVASLTVGRRMALGTDGDREALAAALGADPALDPAALSTEAAVVVAERLAQGPNGTDALEELLDADFLFIQGPALTETGLRGLGGSGQAFVAVAGGTAQTELDASAFLVPLVAGLAGDGMPVAAGEPAELAPESTSFVTELRGEGEVAALISTQDNVDQVPGQVGLALALEGLLRGEPGHYGIKDGASRALPDLP